jgi:hypothetical protein
MIADFAWSHHTPTQPGDNPFLSWCCRCGPLPSLAVTTRALLPHAGSGVAAAAVADELLAATRAELPVLAEREQLLVTWLVSLRSARTRRAYFGDLATWLSSWYRYLAAHDVIAHQPVAVVVRPWGGS